MKTQIFSLCIFACAACAFDIDDALDRLDSTLTISGFQDNFRARLSGTVDLEFYNFQQPAPGLIDSEIDNLFNPRLTLFLDIPFLAALVPIHGSFLHHSWQWRTSHPLG